MFNKNQKPNEIRPAQQEAKEKQAEKNRKSRDNKDAAQEKAAMRSEGGKN